MKKFLKIFFIFVFIFVLFLYFLGSCCSSSSSSSSFKKLTLDEYENLINDVCKSNFVLDAYADNPIIDKLDDFFNKTNLYNYGDFVNGYIDYVKNPDYYPSETFPLVDKSTVDNPITSFTVPLHYNFYGKNRITYSNGVSEVVVCRLDADLTTTTNRFAKGHVTFTRSNSLGYYTSFGFDIQSVALNTYFSGNSGFVFVYYPLTTNVSGIDTNSESWLNLLNSQKRLVFYSSLTNNIHTLTSSSSSAASLSDFVSFNNSSSGLSCNFFVTSQAYSNDYNFISSFQDYQGSTRTKSVNVYYNNHAGDTVTVNNYNQYADYGYVYNNITGSLEFNPDIFVDFFNKSIRPKLEVEFNDIFSKMPDIDAIIKNYTGQLNNLVELINQSSSSSSSFPLATTGTCFTFPPDFFKTYPTLTTEPDITITTVSVGVSGSFPPDVKRGVEWWITQATNFLIDSDLLHLLLIIVSVTITISIFL